MIEQVQSKREMVQCTTANFGGSWRSLLLWPCFMWDMDCTIALMMGCRRLSARLMPVAWQFRRRAALRPSTRRTRLAHNCFSGRVMELEERPAWGWRVLTDHSESATTTPKSARQSRQKAPEAGPAGGSLVEFQTHSRVPHQSRSNPVLVPEKPHRLNNSG